jgi:hypothetical protein
VVRSDDPEKSERKHRAGSAGFALDGSVRIRKERGLESGREPPRS